MCTFVFTNTAIQLSVVYLVFSTAHRQREELMEEMFLLCAAHVGHMTGEDAVQSSAVPDGEQTHGWR